MILGTTEVYYQPPENVVMKYPCIVYQWDHANTQFADNHPYRHHKRYQVTYIDRKVDSDVPDKIANLPMSLFSRSYVADNLNHSVFDLYY